MPSFGMATVCAPASYRDCTNCLAASVVLKRLMPRAASLRLARNHCSASTVFLSGSMNLRSALIMALTRRAGPLRRPRHAHLCGDPPGVAGGVLDAAAAVG